MSTPLVDVARTEGKEFFGRVALAVPPSWTDASVMSFVGPAQRGSQPGVMLLRDVMNGLDVAAYAKEQLTALRLDVKGYSNVAEGVLAGGGGCWAEHTFRASNGEQIQQILAWLADDDAVFVLSLTDAATNFEGSRASFQSMLATFSLR